MPDELLRLDHLSKTFPMGEVVVRAVRDVTLSILAREVVALVGPSGSGKSTILNILAGLDTPTTGSVWYRDCDLATCTPRELTRYRRESIGFVFQFYNLVPNLTARENLMVATEISDDPLDVDEVLALVGLEDRAGHFPSQLSGGEQQRVAIARALAKNPELVFCDEPTGALDFETGRRVLRLLVDARAKLNKTVIIVTHNSALAAAADRVIRLRSGEIVEEHTNDPPVRPEDIEW